MTHGSLFSGIGGFDLAAEWMGWENNFHCENNKFCQQILKHYWPDAELFDDIKQSSFLRYRGSIDVLSGGFPCQPYSHAGKRLGKEDDRHLWPEMLRAIREIQPRWVVGENVYGIVNWSRGLVFDEVQADLEDEGYEVTPYILPACAVNAPHRRDRVWFVAYASGERVSVNDTGIISNVNGNNKSDSRSGKQSGRIATIGENGSTSNTGHKRQEKPEQQAMGSEQLSESGITTNSDLIGQSGSGWSKGQFGSKENGNWKASWADPNGRWPTVSPIRGGDDGISTKLVKQCLEGLGNAVVPQVVFEIFKAIEQVDKLKNQSWNQIQ